MDINVWKMGKVMGHVSGKLERLWSTMSNCFQPANIYKILGRTLGCQEKIICKLLKVHNKDASQFVQII
jgi:hypothetical protein